MPGGGGGGGGGGEDGRTDDGQTDMTKLIDAFRNFAKSAQETYWCSTS